MLVRSCDHVIKQILKESGLTLEDIKEIGISFPGHLDNESGLTVLSENLPSWHNITIKKIFEEKYKKKIHIDDCSRLMALAELWYGQGINCDNFIVFDLGFGIGCGIVINREIFSGAGGKSGEVGHTIVKADGPECTCGRRGCIESLASGWALVRQGEELLRRFPKSILGQRVKSRHNTRHDTKHNVLTTADIIFAANLGDENSKELLNSAGHYIAIGIANSISWFNPSKVILGGSLVQDNETLFNSIMESVKVQTMPSLYEDAVFSRSDLGRFASSIGAATLCLGQYYK